MKRPFGLWILVAAFVSLLSIWLWQDTTYPHTIYEYHQTGETAGQYDDRVEGNVIEAVPIWEPDNPLWVDIIRRAAPISLFVLFIAAVAVEVYFRDRRRQAKREQAYQELLSQK